MKKIASILLVSAMALSFVLTAYATENEDSAQKTLWQIAYDYSGLQINEQIAAIAKEVSPNRSLPIIVQLNNFKPGIHSDDFKKWDVEIQATPSKILELTDYISSENYDGHNKSPDYCPELGGYIQDICLNYDALLQEHLDAMVTKGTLTPKLAELTANKKLDLQTAETIMNATKGDLISVYIWMYWIPGGAEATLNANKAFLENYINLEREVIYCGYYTRTLIVEATAAEIMEYLEIDVVESIGKYTELIPANDVVPSDNPTFTTNTKISSELAKKMNEINQDELIPIYIEREILYFNEILEDSQMKREFLENYWDEFLEFFENAFGYDYTDESNNTKSSLADKLMMERRFIVQKLHTTNNQDFIEKYIEPERKIIHSDSYSTNLIVEATVAEIMKYSEIEGVTEISLYSNDLIVVPQITDPVEPPVDVSDEPQFILGDINDDKAVNIRDALEILMFLANMECSIKDGGKDSLAWNAALIVSEDTPKIIDALEILTFLAGMESNIG